MANKVDILFKTGRFNLSQVGEEFINDCCFGEDLSTWLRGKLVDVGYTVDEPIQEDWGWLLEVRRGSENYHVGVGGELDEDANRPNYGEWRVFVEPRQSMKDRLLRKRFEGQLASELEKMLASESDFESVHVEA